MASNSATLVLVDTARGVPMRLVGKVYEHAFVFIGIKSRFLAYLQQTNMLEAKEVPRY